MSPDKMAVVPALELPARRSRRRWWWVLILALALAAGTWGIVRAVQNRRSTHEQTEKLTTYTVERGDLHITVAESGTLRAKQSVHLWPDIQGRAKVAWLVEEAVTVDSGDLLVLMETEELDKEITDGEIQLKQAVSARVQADEQLAIQKRQNESDVQAAKVKLDIALLELERYQEGEVPKLLRQAKLALEKAEVDKRLAEEDLVGMEDYVAKSYFTKQDHEQRKLALREAIDGLETATKERELLEKFQIPKDRAQRQSDVDQAKTGLDLAERKAKSELAKKEADLEERNFVEQSRSDRLKVLKERLEKMTIRAPQKGLVIYGDDRRWWRRDEIKVGMDVHRGDIIITLPDLDEMEVEVNINEVDLDKVQVGRPAAITLDAYPTLKFRGRVTKVAKLADRQRFWGADIRTFEVIAEIDMGHARQVLAETPNASGEGTRLRPGMSAKAEIDVAALTNVLYLPIYAAYEDRGEHFCYVLEDGEPVPRRIEIGLNNATHVHVKEGLKEGQRVLRYDPTLAAGRRPPTTRPAGAGRPGAAPTTRAATQPASRPATQPQEPASQPVNPSHTSARSP